MFSSSLAPASTPGSPVTQLGLGCPPCLPQDLTHGEGAAGQRMEFNAWQQFKSPLPSPDLAAPSQTCPGPQRASPAKR